MTGRRSSPAILQPVFVAGAGYAGLCRRRMSADVTPLIQESASSCCGMCSAVADFFFIKRTARPTTSAEVDSAEGRRWLWRSAALTQGAGRCFPKSRNSLTSRSKRGFARGGGRARRSRPARYFSRSAWRFAAARTLHPCLKHSLEALGREKCREAHRPCNRKAARRNDMTTPRTPARRNDTKSRRSRPVEFRPRDHPGRFENQ